MPLQYITMSIKKIIKRVFLFFLSVFILFSLTVAFALNFIFTPEKITPVITDLLNENLDADVSCESIELTFFSSFPFFGVDLKNGRVVTIDSSGNTTDTLAQFEHCRVSFNAEKLWRTHDLTINNLTLVNPKIKAVVPVQGKPNWEIVKETSSDTSADSTSFVINSIVVKKLNIKNAQLEYQDFVTHTHAAIDSFEVRLRISDNKEVLTLATRTSGKNISFEKDGYHFAKRKTADFKTKIFYDKKNHRVDFDNSHLIINDIDFLTEGHFRRDTVTNAIHTDLVMEMSVPSLKTFWEIIPSHIIEKDAIDIRGNVALKATAKGLYSENHLPLMDIIFKIDDGVLKYKKFPGEIRHLDADLHAVLDFDNPGRSNLTVKKLLLEGTGVDLKGNATVQNLLKDPKINTSIEGDLDLTILKEKFPFAPDIDAHGMAHIDIDIECKSNEILNNNFNNLVIKGNSVFTDLLISDPIDSIFVETHKTELIFGKRSDTDSRKALGKINITDLKINYKDQHDLDLAGLQIELRAKQLKDTIAALAANISFSDLKYNGINDTRAVIVRSNITAELTPRSTQDNPSVKTTFTVDSAGVWQAKHFVGIKNGNYDFVVSKNREGKWMPRGHVEFNHLRAYTPDFAMPIKMEHSKISINNRAVVLRNAHILFGKSDITLSGQINNLLAKASPERNINATLTLNAEYIDANEIMQVLHDEPPADSLIHEAVAADTEIAPVEAKKMVFKIPKNIQFTFNSNIKRVHYGDLDMDHVKGLLKIEDGHVKLQHFELTTLAAKLVTSINYHAVSDVEAEVDFDLNLMDIEMNNIARIMPAMDSLFPMVKSFEGTARLRMQGTTMLNEEMEVKIPSLRSIAALEAADIMVLDSETFKELANTLKFKNREKNNVKELSMEMIIENSSMEVLPALVEIDRYRLAIGGIQNLDMTYDYHISVLKSPIPFKTGVDIRGNFDDYKISLARAKYKYYFTDKDRLKDKADEEIINKRNEILNRLNFN